MFPCLGSVVYGHIDKSHVLYLRAIKYIFSFHILKHLMLLVWLGFQTKKLLHLPKINKGNQEVKERMLEVLECKENTQASCIRDDNH
jgi:hypothetical protein